MCRSASSSSSAVAAARLRVARGVTASPLTGSVCGVSFALRHQCRCCRLAAALFATGKVAGLLFAGARQSVRGRVRAVGSAGRPEQSCAEYRGLNGESLFGVGRVVAC